MRFAYLAVLVLGMSGCATASGSGGLPEPSEPFDLPGGAPPAAGTYYEYGRSMLERDPGRAADAFYWASRFDPTWAAPLLGRRFALFLQDPSLYLRYLSGRRSAVRSKRAQQLDSLYLRALQLNPILDRRLEAQALRALWTEQMMQSLTREYGASNVDQSAVEFYIATQMSQAGPRTRGWIAHSEGRFSAAEDLYREALKHSDERAEIHADLARVIMMQGRNAEAIEHLDSAIAALREDEGEELVRVYSSKALYYQTRGLAQESMGDEDSARDSYAAALQEDLSYYPAHVHLATLALADGDTTTALAEIAMAGDLRPRDATVLLAWGGILEASGELAGAEAHYRTLREAEPFFPAAARALALTLDAQGEAEAASVEYRAFLDLATPGAPGTREAQARLTALEAAAAGAGGGF